jgi:uncharacterized RDD family membrane protein YckC
MTDSPPPPPYPQDPRDPSAPAYPDSNQQPSQPGQPGQQPGDPGYPAAPPPPPPGPGGWGQAPAYGGPVGYGTPAGYGAPVPYAEWIKRVGAYLVDIVVLLPGYLVAFLGVAIGSVDNSAASGIGVLLAVAGYLGIFAIAIWNLIVRQGRTGWSLGKQVVGIRLIGERTGEPIGPGLTFVRALAHVLDSLPCYLGYLWPLWDAKKQTFADKIMGTVVIEQKKG